jgi:uncharacterized repeat protein (TIGR02543 family)
VKAKQIIAMGSAILIGTTNAVSGVPTTVYAQQDTETIMESQTENEVNSIISNEEMQQKSTQDAITDSIQEHLERDTDVKEQEVKENTKEDVVGGVKIINNESLFSFNSSTGTITGYDVATGGTDVVIPSTIGEVQVKAIADGVFEGMGLTSVIFPDGLEKIGRTAFRNNSLSTVVLPDSITDIGWEGLANAGIQNLTLPSTMKNIPAESFLGNSIISLTLPDSVETIGSGAFMNCGIQTINWGTGIKNIESMAFSNNEIKNLTVSAEVIGDRAFLGNPLETVTLQDSVRTVKTYAFMGMTNQPTLKEINLGNGVENIETNAFTDGLTERIELPISLKTAGTSIFGYQRLPYIETNASNPKVYYGKQKLDSKAINKPQTDTAVTFNLRDFYAGIDATKVEVKKITNGLSKELPFSYDEDTGELAVSGISTNYITLYYSYINDGVEVLAVEQRINFYNAITVKWNDFDDSVLHTDTYEKAYGTSYLTVTPPVDPVRSGYTFVYWDKSPFLMNHSLFEIEWSTIYKACYEENEYIIDYDLGYQSENPIFLSDTVKWTKTKINNYEPARTGYIFNGWYYNEKKVEDSDSISSIAAQDPGAGATIILQAKWLVNSYEVTFDTQGGSIAAGQNVEYEGLVSKASDPLRDGYTFAGWYKEADCQTAWDFTIDKMPAENITLYAKWLANSYEVTFDTQGGSIAAGQNVEYEGLVSKPSDPLRDGYTFAGWYKEADCQTAWDFTIDKMPAENITLYAKWLANSYEVTFDTQGGSIAAGQNVEYEGLVSKPSDPLRDGYTFAGWYKEADCQTAWDFTIDKMPAENITLYAKWIANSYEVTFDTQGGSITAGQSVEYEGLISKPSNPLREGYTFAGWYKEADCQTAWDFTIDKMPAENITLYAKWIVNSYEVTFDTQGGGIAAGQSVEYEGLISKPSNPLREGYTFAGWYKEADCQTAWDFTIDKMPAENITLYAKWIVNSYEVTFDTQGGSITTGQSVEYEGLVSKPSDPLRGGYTFAGWYKEADCQTAWDFTIDKMPAENITLYAKWLANSYEVTFDTQGGSITGGQNVEYEGLVSKPSDPLREGYTFAGWYKEAGCQTAWDFTIDKMPAENITLYAKWISKVMNPNHAPVIYAADKVLIVGDKFNPLDDVTAYDDEDGLITLTEESIIVNNVDTNTAGIYIVTYKVVDSQGASMVKTITITVKEKENQDGSDLSEKTNNAVKIEKTNSTEKIEKANNTVGIEKNKLIGKGSVPKTGEVTSVGLFGSMLAGSFGILAFPFVKRKKKEETK